ncbi:MAG: hypothetical protein ACERKO_00565 [Acetanaerobacterium sp.]
MDNGTTHTFTFDTLEEMNDYIGTCDEDIDIIEATTVTGHGEPHFGVLSVVIIFVVGNLSTVVFLCIYFGYRKKMTLLGKDASSSEY